MICWSSTAGRDRFWQTASRFSIRRRPLTRASTGSRPKRPSWRAELHAGDYVLELACTFRISGEEVYARQLRYVIAHWIASNPPASGTGWQPHVLARRLRNWMLSADFARSDWERDAEFGNLVAKSLALQMAFLLSQLDSLPSSAARLDASRALLCASRFFAGNKAREAWQSGFDLLASELAVSRAEPWPHARLAKAQALMEWNLLSAPGADSAFSGEGVTCRPGRDGSGADARWILAALGSGGAAWSG